MLQLPPMNMDLALQSAKFIAVATTVFELTMNIVSSHGCATVRINALNEHTHFDSH